MPPTPGENPPQEQTKYETYKPSLEKQKEVIDDLLERFGGEAAEKTRALRKHTTEISRLLMQLAKTEKQSGATEDELNAITQAIDTVQKNFDIELDKIRGELHDVEQEGTAYEKAEHTIFVVERSELLDLIDEDIKSAEGLSAKLRKELKAIRKKILEVTIHEEDEEKSALAIFKDKEKKDPDSTVPDDVTKFQQYLAGIRTKNDAAKGKILATIEQELTVKRDEIIQEQQKKDDEARKEKDTAHDEALTENKNRDRLKQRTVYEGSDFEQEKYADFVKERAALLDDMDIIIERIEDLDPALQQTLKDIRTRVIGVTISSGAEATRKQAALQTLATELKAQEPAITAAVKNGSKSEKKHHTDFITARTSALDTINALITGAANSTPEIQKELEDIKKELLLLAISDDTVVAEQQFKDTHNGQEYDHTNKAHKKDFKALLDKIVADNKKKGDDALAEIQARLKEVETVIAAEAKQKKEKGVSDRAARARELLQKVTGRESLSEHDIQEKLKTQFPELLTSIFNGFTGAAGETDKTLKAQREKLLVQAAWKLFGKEGDPVDNKKEFIDKKVGNEAEYNRYFWWKETVRTVYMAAQERIQQEAAARIAKEKADKGILKTAVKTGAGYMGAGLAVKLAAGTALLNPFSSIALGVGIGGIAIYRGVASWKEASRAKEEQKKVAREWKDNKGAQDQLQALMTESFVEQQRHKKREDDALQLVQVGKKEGWRGTITSGMADFQTVRAEIATLQKPWQEGRRNDLIDRYKAAIDELIKDGGSIRVQIEKQIKEERTGDKNADLSNEEKAIVDSVCRAYRMEQMNRLVENETKEHLSGILQKQVRRGVKHLKEEGLGGIKLPEFLRPGDEIDDRFRQGAVMTGLGIAAYAVPGLRRVLLGYGGMKMGGAIAEGAYRKIEKMRGKEEKAPPTSGDLAALKQAILSIDGSDKSAMIALREKVTETMADVRVYLQSEGALKHTLGNVELRRSLEELENMVVAQSAALDMDDAKMDLLWKAAREKKAEAVGREKRHERVRFIGSAVGLAAGIVAGDYLARAAEQAKANAQANVDSAKSIASNAETSTAADLESAGKAAEVATKSAGALKTLADSNDWSDPNKTLHDVQKAVAGLTITSDTPADALNTIVGDVDKAAGDVDNELRDAMATAANVHNAADLLKNAPDIGWDDEKQKIADEALKHAQAADKVVGEIATKAAEAHQAADEAHALQEQIQRALETKATGEVFSDGLRTEDANYHAIGEAASTAGGSATTTERWFGGEWNADGKETNEQLRYSLDAKNFMHDNGISVNEQTGKLILAHDNENITFRGAGNPIKSIEIARHTEQVLSDGQKHDCISVTTIDDHDNVRVMYIRKDGQYHGDRSGDVPNTGSWESQTNTASRVDGEQYMPTGALHKGDAVTKLQYHEVANTGGFLSASEMKGADGVVRHLELIDSDGDSSVTAADMNPGVATYHYAQTDPHDVTHVLDQGLMGKSGTVSAASIHEGQTRLGLSSTLAVDTKDPKAIENALKNITEHPVAVTNSNHEIVYARVVDGATKHVETTSVNISESFPHDNVTATLNADKTIDIKVGNDVVLGFDDKTVALDASGKITIDGKSIEDVNKTIGDAILKHDITTNLPGYTGHEAAASALGIHVENNHLVIPDAFKGQEQALKNLFADNGKMTACGNSAEHLRYALEHKTVTAPALTAIFENPSAQIPEGTTDVVLNKVFSDNNGAIFDACKSNGVVDPDRVAFALKHNAIDAAKLTTLVKEQDLFHAVLEKPVSLDQASALQKAFENLNPQPTVDGSAILFDQGGAHFSFDHSGVHLLDERGNTVQFALTGEQADHAIPLDGVTDTKVTDTLTHLTERATLEKTLATKIADAVKTGSRFDVDIDRVMDTPYGDMQGETHTFLKAVGVSEQTWWKPQTWGVFTSQKSAESTHAALKSVFINAFTALSIKPNPQLSIAENLRLALEAKYK